MTPLDEARLENLAKAVLAAKGDSARWEAFDALEEAANPQAILRLIAALHQRGEALERIVQWSEAYPLNIFPEPDFKAVRAALEAAGITLGSVSASNMRHVVAGVGRIARAALNQRGE